ncbi:MAG: hypothetical protein ACI83B_001314 [Sediminicola sp.]
MDDIIFLLISEIFKMKNLFFGFAMVLLMASCNDTKKSEATSDGADVQEIAYQSFGDKIDDKGVLSRTEIQESYKNLKPGDSVAVKFKSEVKAVCQSKGCWMRMDMGEEEAMVKFKDYGFFMPKDIAGQEVIVDGMAYIEEVSIDEQRHYAEDAGKSAEEIAAITEPQRTLSFTSSGVLIPKKQ